MNERIPEIGLQAQGIETRATLHWNLVTARLIETAVARGEGKLSADGPLVVETGEHTGRSAQDKFMVRDDETRDTVWWGKTNKPMSPDDFAALKADFFAALGQKEDLFVQDLYGGSQPEHRVRVRVVTELAWHNLFIRTMLVRPEEHELREFAAEYTIIDLPSFRADPARHGCRSSTVIAVNMTEKLILIGGTRYAGEMKKSVFGLLNYLLPTTGVMPMHCSANMGADGSTAVFFGLSGTGKTTLSADARRTLIGDDEHGWSDTAVFNFEGGCYAKMIRLSPEAEPEIFATTKRFGTVLENVVMDPVTRQLDLNDSSLAENSRGAYPIDFIPNASKDNMGGVPRNIVMLTADAYGILPPIAKLTPEQAMYHFLSGYTARVAGTEIGVTEPDATFSTCFGAPFMPRHPSVYGNLLKERIAKGGVDCWLVNTGWTGGKYGVGHRMPIKATRALLNAALDGSLNQVEFRTDPNFGFQVPVSVPGVDGAILNPRDTWADKAAYDATAAKLVDLFNENFQQFADHVDEGVRVAAPKVTVAA
ncbi:phosphoenolpyruvate carboxykinase [ATP] [Sphingomonas paucimobilis]|uniref:Phosphoenolpyruvate carboxykinase (ATP) n=2 Tax=Sphingomonas paucimobilis TaxID=13689 RepID=A0A411LFV8_SPHPI|nr:MULTISPECIES: phosphoenolpyruvate carboxykinase [Sphingomonas]MBQ1480036.1 phosphoenolpyruvate carboxykinase [Sphingomonas sp.]MCM3679061.1 phosphoenolpyruvate carboxykinase [Sphingomonas paucimobilis]MDG5971815.1 phosphoenolpyruvate carboxykinase [Sphingomonas paucimobilis]NNG58175.1 phosphoenolpyruvate carboxykinase [Sphingomonas paucimobilis]QBE91214.1 phosphoenolpyruvate carboxykinase [Sphingomonas paucimobilis]